MLVDDEYRKRVDRMLFDSHLALAGAPRRGDAWLDSGEPADGDQPYEIALNGIQKRLILGAMRASGADKGFDSTISGMTGGGFGPDQIKSLENQVLDKASWDEAMALRGITEGPPVDLSRNQKTVVDGLMNRLDGPLADDARAAYQRALRAGQIRIR